MGLDVGDRRIGVALSDAGGVLATPFTIIDRSDEQHYIDTIIDIVNQHEVEHIIVGLPISMDGSIGAQAEKTKVFVKSLTSQTRIPVEFRDERLTTFSARRLMQEARTKKSKRKSRDDAIAAALILQGYLDEGR